MDRMRFDEHIRFHRLMWLNMAQAIAERHHTVDPYYYKQGWCRRYNLFAINNCFACTCGTELWVDANGDHDKILGNDTMCGYCPLDWNSTGDLNREYMCEYCYDRNDPDHDGLWVLAINIHQLFQSCYLDCSKKLSSRDTKMMDKLWKKQCKLCYKIAMLPVREDVENLITESL